MPGFPLSSPQKAPRQGIAPRDWPRSRSPILSQDGSAAYCQGADEANMVARRTRLNTRLRVCRVRHLRFVQTCPTRRIATCRPWAAGPGPGLNPFDAGHTGPATERQFMVTTPVSVAEPHCGAALRPDRWRARKKGGRPPKPAGSRSGGPRSVETTRKRLSTNSSRPAGRSPLSRGRSTSIPRRSIGASRNPDPYDGFPFGSALRLNALAVLSGAFLLVDALATCVAELLDLGFELLSGSRDTCTSDQHGKPPEFGALFRTKFPEHATV